MNISSSAVSLIVIEYHKPFAMSHTSHQRPLISTQSTTLTAASKRDRQSFAITAFLSQAATDWCTLNYEWRKLVPHIFLLSINFKISRPTASVDISICPQILSYFLPVPLTPTPKSSSSELTVIWDWLLATHHAATQMYLLNSTMCFLRCSFQAHFVNFQFSVCFLLIRPHSRQLIFPLSLLAFVLRSTCLWY